MEISEIKKEKIEYEIFTKIFSESARQKLANLMAHGYEIEGAVLLKLSPIGPDKSFYISMDSNGMMKRHVE